MKTLNIDDNVVESEQDKTTVFDMVYENQRGSGLFGQGIFSSKGLLPGVDYHPWSKETGEFELPLESYNCPPTWMWIGDWMVDMSIDCDSDGWQYAGKFSTHNWVGHRSKTSLVRRRRWIRLRKRVPGSIPHKPASTSDPEQEVLQTISAALREFPFKANDRERLGWLKTLYKSKVLTQDSIATYIVRILGQFDYETSKIKACELLKELVNNSKDKDLIVRTVLESLLFYSDKESIVNCFQ